MSPAIDIILEDTHSDYSAVHKDTHTQIQLNYFRLTKASEDWRDDPANCYRILCNGKTQDTRKLMHDELFNASINGTMPAYISKMRLQFIAMRTGK